MADLISPGISVTVTDDTVSSSSTTGTVPLFIIATAQDKLISGSTTVADGTTAANAGTLQLVTSQKETLTTFGNPVFQTDDGSVVQGDELNEVGLHAVYSYMGIADRAYVMRADINLTELEPTATEPTGTPTNGTLWLDTSSSTIEAYVSSTDTPTSYYDWTSKTVTFVSAEEVSDVDTSSLSVDDLVLRHVPSTGQMLMYKYSATGLVQDVTTLSLINKVPTTGGVWIRDGFTKSGSNYYGTYLLLKRYGSTTDTWTTVPVYTGNSFYEVESKSGVFDSTYYAGVFDSDSYSFTLYQKSTALATTSTAVTPTSSTLTTAATSDMYLTIKYLSNTYKVVAVNSGEIGSVATIITNMNKSTALINAGFSFGSDSGAFYIKNSKGYSFEVTQTGTIFSSTDAAKLSTESTNYVAVTASKLELDTAEPTGTAADGTLWFYFSNSDSLEVGLYTADVDTATWVAVETSNMYVQLDEPAADRDFWVQPITQGTEGYVFYKNISDAWTKLDTSDQTTLNGIIFEDFVNGDVPSANLYHDGMLAVDLGTTEGVVKKYTDGVWEVVSGTGLDGSALFGRYAQRQMIVEALAAAITASEEARSEYIEFNLMCCPGYVEVLDELVTLNTDRGETAFIVTDVPARLEPTSSNIEAWATNTAVAGSNGEDGRVTAYEYAAMYMGWCLGTNVDGEEVAIPGSSVAMRTYAYSDSISYVWQPPAGTTNGLVSNAASVGYITDESEYSAVVYNKGQRDTMYSNNINPIAMRPNRGLLVYGDKTLSSDSTSALSRVNVARLVVYIRKQLELLAEPFLFRLNTTTTRKEFSSVVTSFLSEIVQLNGLYDFLVVCDSTNNTTDTINSNELWMDVALVPTMSINFIYIPIRLETEIS